MQEEIKYNKDEKWISYEQLAETPQQTIAHLEQEVKHWQMECKEAKAKGEWTYDLVRKKVDRLEQELKWANDEEKYLKDCCIKAGKELEKHSFKWDGKEKNLVVQALQLNQLYEKLEQERDELKKACDKCKLFDIEKTNRDLLERIDNLEQENKELKEIDKKICEDCEKEIKFYWDAFEEIKNIILTYESKEWNCFNEMDVKLEQIFKVINEVIGEY